MNTFKKVSYFLLLILAWFSSSYTVGFSGHYIAAFLGFFGVVPDTPYTVYTITQISIGFIHGLIVFRLICWVKAREIYIPELYKGIIALIGYIATGFILTVLAVYASLLSSSTIVGVSGVPMGIALIYAGYLSPIPIVICEIRELYRSAPVKNPLEKK
jgi:hypothetical protein